MVVERRRRRPASTLASRENQLISDAVDLAERHIREDRVSAQVLTHYLKLGSTREQLEQERLRNENQLLRAKIANLETAKNVEALYAEAIQAMRTYAGQDVEEMDFED